MSSRRTIFNKEIKELRSLRRTILKEANILIKKF
jgi:hypothetical protein